MAAERLSMRKIKEVLRLSALGRSPGQVARSLDIGENTVRRYLRRAEEAGLGWPLEPELGDAALEARLFPPPPSGGTTRPVPDWAEVQRELRRKGVTLQLLWLEYKAVHPEAGYQYTQFCEHYRRWRDRLDPVLRQGHRAGEKTFVDYAGQTMPVVDPTTGEIREGQIFVGVLGASNFTFAEATWTQTLPDWIGSHVRMFAYFGGASAAVVPDNLRSGVTRSCFYDPDVNPTYQDLATHYGTAVLPTRPGRPRDKAKVESGVQVAERWLLAPLRNQLFHGLGELNRALAERLEHLNNRLFQKIEGSRRSLFEAFERDALRPLPPEPFEIAERRKARVNIDYHVDVLGHLYSVPYPLVRTPVEVRLTTTTVEISTTAAGWPPMCAASVREASPPSRATGPSPTRLISTGAPRAWSAGRPRPGPAPPPSSSTSWTAGLIPSTATAPASASCASVIATALSASRPPAAVPSASAAPPTGP
jgi:transposase